MKATGHERIGCDRAVAHLAQKLIAARRPVGLERCVGRHDDLGLAGPRQRQQPVARRVIDLASRPMRAAGAPAQRPTQGARTTRMAAGSTLPASSASFSAPASMQLIELHTP